MSTNNPTSATSAGALTAPEARELQRLEHVIHGGLEQFLEVGRALAAIRDRRLYRQTHDTFEAYCRERWSFSKTHANRLIAGAAATARLGDVEVRPTAESQVRPLTGLPPAQAVVAWQRAVDVSGGRPTSQDVREAVQEALGAVKKQPARVSQRAVVFADRLKLFTDLTRWGRQEGLSPELVEKFAAFLRGQFH